MLIIIFYACIKHCIKIQKLVYSFFIIRIYLLEIRSPQGWSKTPGVKDQGVRVQIQRILLTEGGPENTTDLRLQGGADIVGLVPEIEDRVQVRGTEEEKNPVVLNKNGNSRQLPRLKLLLRIQIALVVMYQRYIINIRYS